MTFQTLNVVFSRYNGIYDKSWKSKNIRNLITIKRIFIQITSISYIENESICVVFWVTLKDVCHSVKVWHWFAAVVIKFSRAHISKCASERRKLCQCQCPITLDKISPKIHDTIVFQAQLFSISSCSSLLGLGRHFSHTFHTSNEQGTTKYINISNYCKPLTTCLIPGTTMTSKTTENADGMLQAATNNRQVDDNVCKWLR